MSKHETGFIKILALIFCLGLIQLSNSGCTEWNSQARMHEISNQPYSAILRGTKVFETDLLAKKVFYLAINSNIINTGNGFAAKQESFCTAVALSRKVVMTAAHCVDQINPEKINLIEGVSPWISPLKPELWRQVTSSLVHPKYKRKNPEYDVALLKLNSDLPEDGPLVIFDRDPLNLSILLAGYGFRVNSVYSNPSANKGANDFLKNNSGELFYISKILKSFALNDLTFNFDQNQNETVCIGDSGGPALVFDEDLQTYSAIGLLSGSIEATDPNTNLQFEDFDFCSGTPVYTNLNHPEVKSWIELSVNQLMNPLIETE